MKIQFASDLHLEFPQNEEFLKINPLQPEGDILLLAGDIVPFAVMDKYDDFFSYVSDNFQATYWIPGNHEYYYYDIADKSGTLNEKIRSNVFIVNNEVVRHENINLIFCSLWSNISMANQWQIERGMSDFHVIKNKGDRFSAEHYNQLHVQSIEFLNQELHHNNTHSSVVATHHVPTLLNYPEKYKSSVLNEAFAVELFDLIESKGPDYWIYGHSHCNTHDFKIGNTHIRTNQLGYVKYNEQIGYKNEKIIKI
ncbi:MAG: metallophosphoesterase [Bacteroidetes bacterium]|nr:metallophosphoesterase [Bacteroidota bacterium]